MKSVNLAKIVFLSVFLVLVMNYDAHSESDFWVFHEDGSSSCFMVANDGSKWLWVYDKDGDIVYGSEIGNPNPDDESGGGKPTKESIEDFIKRHYQGSFSKGVQTNNPFSIKQSSQGKGLAPRWNPSGQEKEYDGGSSGGSGPGTNSGDISGWVKSMANKGTNGEEEDDESDGGDDRPDLGTTGSVRPERINPVHFQSLSTHGTKSQPAMKNHTGAYDLHQATLDKVAAQREAFRNAHQKKRALKRKAYDNLATKKMGKKKVALNKTSHKAAKKNLVSKMTIKKKNVHNKVSKQPKKLSPL